MVVVEEVVVVCAVGTPSGLDHLVEEVGAWPTAEGRTVIGNPR